MAKQQYCAHGETDSNEPCMRCALEGVEAPTINLHIILDVSVSMASRWSQTISGLNEYIAALRVDESPYCVTITQFAAEHEIADIYTKVGLDNIAKFDAKSFRPNGSGTALWSAVGSSLKKIDTGEPVLFVVITDGEENSSNSYTSEVVSKMIEERQKLGNYTFAYLGVAKEAWGNEAKVRAFASSNMKLDNSTYGASTYATLAGCTRSFSSSMRSNRMSGQSMSVPNLFDSGDNSSAIGIVTPTVTSANPLPNADSLVADKNS